MDNIHINWFPGHMAKAQRMIREHLKLVDVVIELLDARIPVSSANPVIKEIIENKPRIVALNKADLAEAEWNEYWSGVFRDQGLQVVALEAITGKGTKALIGKVEQAASDTITRLAAKGIRPRAVRAMILGIPNVGKSSLINRLLGAATVRTADKPGVTRGKQWIKISKNLELLDTPGVLWPKIEDSEVALKLAITGAINDEVYDLEQVMSKFLCLLREHYSERIVERYKLNEPLPEENEELLGLIGAKRGCLRAGGIVDYDKARKIILNEFRGGKLGRFTLDRGIENSSKT
ncbi:Ribosome biogenesis GTPase A [Propionispora sp. 2/2-37]|uniref:ribosome biogenesis GTPase YlqF n=1 Tax=Propionispora sp. 2/2-37 TaxID=1677858 RepID=UPI0006BB949B|nr:ribosome biogenesis GTPase YlqF [Propionispora sp. 2/2-37]CUH95629.1 Ribosome biogenesis GTPase A [Propionispora sp. 2/2-37]